ncbi:hypothetical protein PMAYCL1PPCAC_25317, partial [Pristionchus mayeri]
SRGLAIIFASKTSFQAFHVVLKTLNNPACEIKGDIALFESILVIADQFDIKIIIDGVEQSLIANMEISVAEKLLFVDKHDSYRFIKLHTRALGWLGEDTDNWLALMGSTEFPQLSNKANFAFAENLFNIDQAHRNPNYYLETCTEMTNRENKMEGLDISDMVASGSFPSVFGINKRDSNGFLRNVDTHWTEAN